MIAHPVTPTQYALNEARKARQARQIQMARRVKANDNARAIRPLWACEEMTFNAHVIDYRRAMILCVTPRKSFIIDRAKDFGFTYDEVTAKTRRADIVYARQMIMLDAKDKWPELTLPEIGRLFGGFDHTTVLHALRRAEDYRSGKVPPYTPTKRVKSKGIYGMRKRLKPEVQEKMVTMFLEWGKSRSEIAEEIGVAYKTVINVLRKNGIKG